MYFYRKDHYLGDTVALILTSRIMWIVLENKIDQLDTEIWYLGLRSLREDKVKLIRGSEPEGSNDFEVTESRLFHSFLPAQPTRTIFWGLRIVVLVLLDCYNNYCRWVVYKSISSSSGGSSSKSGCQHDWVRVLVTDLLVYPHWWKGLRSIWSLFFKALIQSTRASHLWPNVPPMSSLPNTIILGIKFSPHEFWGDIQTIARAKGTHYNMNKI